MNQRKDIFETQTGLELIPAKLNQRKCTDVVCIIFLVLFNVTIMVLATIFFDVDDFIRSTYPSDSDGRVCGIDLPAYPYVYFGDLPSISKRICVAKCPLQGDLELQCYPSQEISCKFTQNEAFKMTFYLSYEHHTNNGYFCSPADPVLNTQVEKNANLSVRNKIFASLSALKWSIPICLLLSLIFFILVQFIPKIMNYAVLFAGTIALVAALINIIIYSNNSLISRILLGVTCLLLIFIVIYGSYKYKNSLRIHVSFLEFAAKSIAGRKGTLVYILLFLIIMMIFSFILMLQLVGLLSYGESTFDKDNSLYYTLKQEYLIPIVIVVSIQALWGFSIIKEAFNFCVSANSSIWYLHDGRKLKTTNWLENWEGVFSKDKPQVQVQGVFQPLFVLIYKHFGSIVASGFMMAFFSFGDMIYDLFRYTKPDQSEEQSCLKTCNLKLFCLCQNTLDMVRPDSMAFIYLTSNPYCNSARYCEYLSSQSILLDNSQNLSKIYRLCCHVLIISLLVIISLYVEEYGSINIYSLIFIALYGYFISTFFVCIHCDAVEAITIIYLLDEEITRREEFLHSRVLGIDMLKKMKIQNKLIEALYDERDKQITKKENPLKLSRKKSFYLPFN